LQRWGIDAHHSIIDFTTIFFGRDITDPDLCGKINVDYRARQTPLGAFVRRFIARKAEEQDDAAGRMILGEAHEHRKGRGPDARHGAFTIDQLRQADGLPSGRLPAAGYRHEGGYAKDQEEEKKRKRPTERAEPFDMAKMFESGSGSAQDVRKAVDPARLARLERELQEPTWETLRTKGTGRNSAVVRDLQELRLGRSRINLLIKYENGNTTVRYKIDEERVVVKTVPGYKAFVGRTAAAEDAGVRIDKPYVSGRHIEIESMGGTKCRVTNLSETNEIRCKGVFIRGPGP